jgi:hypothetical protein
MQEKNALPVRRSSGKVDEGGKVAAEVVALGN